MIVTHPNLFICEDQKLGFLPISVLLHTNTYVKRQGILKYRKHLNRASMDVSLLSARMSCHMGRSSKCMSFTYRKVLVHFKCNSITLTATEHLRSNTDANLGKTKLSRMTPFWVFLTFSICLLPHIPFQKIRFLKSCRFNIV